MVRMWGKKRLRPVFTAYLAFAVMGAFTLSMAESLRFDDPVKDQLSSGSYTAIHHTIDCLLEAPGITGRANGHYQSPLRNGVLRELMPAGIYNAAVNAAGSFSQAGKNHQTLIEKPLILLKLRI